MKKQEVAPIIIGKLMNIGGMLQRKANQILAPFDLNHQQFSILFEIAKAERVTQKAMVNRLLLEKAHVSKVIKKLCGMKLIDITESETDKRSSWLSITDHGRETVKKCRKSLMEWDMQWVEKLDSAKHQELMDNLTELQSLFKQMMSE